MKISSGQVKKQYFTVEQANAMIPYLEKAFTRILQLQEHIRAVYAHLEQTDYAPQEENFSVYVEGASGPVIHRRGTLKGLVGSLRNELNAIHRKGALVKGLDRGLVDWYAKSDGRDVFLCWQLGENQINYWHPVEAGFQGRRPISEL